MVWRTGVAAALVLLGGLSAGAPADDKLAPALSTVRNVGPEGQGHREAIAAWKVLSESPVADLPPILTAFDNANPLALNWLRSAVETIVEREQRAGKPLPTAALEQFLMETRHNPLARRFVFELLVKNDPAARNRFVSKMLSDPSVELRRDAVQELIDRANQAYSRKDNAAAKPVYLQAMSYARDSGQITFLVKRLEEIGEKVDLPRHFGFLMSWKVIGPFENTGRKGFATVFPPEEKLDLTKSYPGKGGKTLQWKEHSTKDNYGVVDLNQIIEQTKEVTAYATTDFVNSLSEKRDVEFRLGTGNAWKVWLNGKLLFAREEYHRGKRVDQYRLKAELQPGKNTILIKVCQDQEKYSWTEDWQFQFRVCDAAGTAVLSAAAKPSPQNPDSGKKTDVAAGRTR